MTRHVLLVESSPELRDQLANQLVAAGCQVDCVMTGTAMGRALGATHYDCVLLDLDGPDFGLTLADHAAVNGSRIIIVPGSETDCATLTAKGRQRLGKPFTADQIDTAISQARGPEGHASALPRQRLQEDEEVRCYEAQIASCHRLAAATTDPLAKAVYEAMAAEFIAKER